MPLKKNLKMMKRNQYIQNRDSIKKEKEKENLEHNKYKNQQRGGVINIPPKDNNINNNNEEEDIDNLIDNIRDDRKVIRRKRTLH